MFQRGAAGQTGNFKQYDLYALNIGNGGESATNPAIRLTNYGFTGDTETPKFSPVQNADGTYTIAFSSHMITANNFGFRYQIFTIKFDPTTGTSPNAANPTQVTAPRANGFTVLADAVTPSFSPDGTRLVYSSNQSWGSSNSDKDYEIVEVPSGTVNAANPEYLLTDNAKDDFAPVWGVNTLAGNKEFITWSEHGADYDVWRMDAPTAAWFASATPAPADLKPVSVAVATGDDNTPTWSLDGNNIVYSTNRDGNFELYAMRYDGLLGSLRLTRDGNSSGAHADGHRLGLRRRHTVRSRRQRRPVPRRHEQPGRQPEAQQPSRRAEQLGLRIRSHPFALRTA